MPLVSLKLRTVFRAAILGFIVLPLMALPSLSASSDWFEHEHGAVRLISANAGVGNEQTIDLGL
jgi:hypothetical protein